MRYALPFPPKGAVSTSDIIASGRAVLGPRGASSVSSIADIEYQLLQRNSDFTASDRSTVHRSETAAGASELTQGLTDASLERGWEVSAAPVGLSQARCVSRRNEACEDFLCRVQVGRYVGQVIHDTERIAQQMISAQFLILAQADQKAA